MNSKAPVDGDAPDPNGLTLWANDIIQLRGHHEDLWRARTDTAILAEVIRPPGLAEPARGAHVLEYLRRARGVAERLTTAQATALSQAEWLWHLRRLPDSIFQAPGAWAPGVGYERNLSESISGTAGAEQSSRLRPRGQYAVTRDIAFHIGLFVAGVRRLAAIEWSCRCAARGLSFRWPLNEALPLLIGTHEQLRPLQRYDFRRGHDGFLRRLGTSPELETLPIDERWFVLNAVRLADPRFFTFEYDNHGPGYQKRQVLRAYRPFVFSLKTFVTLSSVLAPNSQSWPPREFWQLALLLSLAKAIARDVDTAASLYQFGYLSVDAGFFAEMSERLMPSRLDLLSSNGIEVGVADATGLIDALARTTGSAFPLRMPSPIRKDGPLELIDVHGASTALEPLLALPFEQGAVANARAAHFEDRVQDAIDDSLWKPPARLSSLRRRVIRLKGQNLTDVDAIGARAGVVLIASAKSRLYSLGLDSGDYRASRNASTHLSEALAAARELETTLDSHPEGDNYDFTGYRVAVVVCTPWAVFSTDASAEDEVLPGLARDVSFAEFSDFVKR